MKFRISSRKVLEITEASRSDFLEEKFGANFEKNFGSPEVEGSTSGPLKRGAVTDISQLRTLLAIRQKWHKQSF